MSLEIIIVVAGFACAAFWRRDPFLYIISGPVVIGFGFAWFPSHFDWLGFIMSAAIVILGGYFWVLAVMYMMEHKQ